MGDSITVKFKLTEENYCWHQKYFTRPIYLILDLFITSVFYGLLFAVLSELFIDSLFISFLVVLIISAVFYVLMFFLLQRLSLKTWKKQYHSDKFLQMESTYCIHTDGIDLYFENSNTKLKWDDLYVFRETKESFLIFLSQNKYYIMPKKYFIDETQINTARAYFKNLPIRKSVNKSRRTPFRIICWAIIVVAIIMLYLTYKNK